MNKTNLGLIYGCIGVVIFAGSMPATRIAINGFSPEYLTILRATIAGLIALFCLIVFCRSTPNKQQFKSLIIVALGVVIGFPLFTALALQTISAARSVVFIGILPLSTAIFAVLRAHEKPKIQFWLFALLGCFFVVFFMLNQAESTSLNIGDLYMLCAIIACGFGYAEGGKLSKDLAGWQVISWALVITLPFMLILSRVYLPANFDYVNYPEILALLYVSLFSMLIGFFFWYKGLALGGIAKIGLVQLIQPILGLILCAFLLHEYVSFQMMIISIAVIFCVAFAKKYA
ncbi:DMT family transporter [Acinetobacter gerneri]|uniref:DMT family transporter n=1 Tax=Acinetobacter gerneri TaxID=202952 RepID=UPI0028B2283F|nr:DMT family transporter [Acinetobacter gerneri]